MKLFQFDSLRARYIAAAVVMAICMVIAAVIGYYTVDGVRSTTANNIQSRHELMEYSRHIRQALWGTHQSLDFFLLDPYENPQAEKIHDSIDQALVTTELLIQHPWIKEKDKTELLELLKDSLLDLTHTITLLVEMRNNPLRQYPALGFANKRMLPSRNNVNNAFVISFNEILAMENKQAADKHYRLFVELRHWWTQMVSNFRVHMANRLGTFNADSLPTQVQAIENQYQFINGLLNNLKIMDAADEFGFETSDALQTIIENIDIWYTAFEHVRDTHGGKQWRADIPVATEILEPQLEKIWGVLLTVDLIIENSAVEDVKGLTHLVQNQTVLLWFLTIFGLSFIVVVFFYFERILFKPIVRVCDALKAEANGIEGVTLPLATTKEIQMLVDAFSGMRKQVHKRQIALEHQALHDELTGLSNRVLLMDRLQYAIQYAKREQHSLALLIMDLDRFKEVNDTLGHSVGDHLLKEVGSRLMANLRQVDTVARLGGDEFAILLTDANAEQAEAIAQKVTEAIEMEFNFDGFHLFIGSSIGIAVFPEHGTEAQSLIQRADVAMYVAKRSQLGFSFYKEEEDQYSIDRLALIGDLREAISNNNIELHYQPKFDIHSGKMLGVEALLRWEHPRFGLIPPDEIIPLAEQTGLVNPLFYWVAERALQQYEEWRAKGFDFSIAINLSVVNLQNNDLVDKMRHCLNEHQIPENRLILEITESAMMINPGHALDTLLQIHNMGVQLTIDDFGTGYSSLTYLKQMPVNEIKIDKSFVINMTKDEDDKIIVRSIIELAHNMGHSVIAEGVENEETWQLLKSMQCDAAQGFYKKMAVTADELEAWLLSQG